MTAIFCKKMLVRSETFPIPAHTVGRGTWAEMQVPEKTGRRFFFTRILNDGTEKTTWTNLYGEGLFSSDRSGAEYQITGTGQFSINDSNKANAKRWIKARFRKDIEEGMEIEFDFSDF